jgi:hypothetical protein
MSYRYLPAMAQLVTDEQGRPQFSFVRYAMNRDPDPESSLSITEADGGAILTFLVKVETPEDVKSEAEREVRRLTGIRDAELLGPVIFQEGRYTLVSSIVGRDRTGKRVALATGRAPVLEGNAIALSFQLDTEQAALFLESMQMNTPDVSLVYEMSFSGLSDAYNAELVVDWTAVQKSSDFSAGGSLYYVGADVEVVIDELRRENAVRLVVQGSNSNMDAIVNRLYDRVAKMLFDPIEPARTNKENRGSLIDALSTLTEPENITRIARGVSGFGFNATYKAKTIKRTGTSVFNFDQQETVQRYATIVFNIGDLYAEYGDDPAYFRAVNLYDPVYEQRVVHVGLDGALLPEFDRFVNSVSLTLKKTHDNGVEELRELVLDRDRVRDGIGALQLVYGWNGDDDREGWLEYEYRTRWSFQNGGVFETEWQPSSAPMIDLFAPYERRSVDLLGDLRQLERQAVRAVVVRVTYPFFGGERSERRIIYTSAEPVNDPIQLTQPLGDSRYDVSVLWQLIGGKQIIDSYSDDTGLIVIDEPPDS